MSLVGDFIRKITTKKTATAAASAATGNTIGLITGIIGVGAALLGGGGKKSGDPIKQASAPFSGSYQGSGGSIQISGGQQQTPAWLWPVVIVIGAVVVLGSLFYFIFKGGRRR